MLPFLAKLHAIAAERGDGLHPAFLNIRAVETLTVVLPSNDAEPATPLGDGSTSIRDKSQAREPAHCTSARPSLDKTGPDW
jgi:hypothetical protein